ncbi:photosystem II reaction center protein Ycf12/Psb30 [Prochlorococcus marinus]
MGRKASCLVEYKKLLINMGNLLPLVAVFLAGPAIIALIFYRRGV